MGVTRRIRRRKSGTGPNRKVILATFNDGICRLILNRPHVYNALSLQLMETMIAYLDELAKDDQVKVVVIAGAGRGFCAGHDLQEMRAHPTRAHYRRTFNVSCEMMMALSKLPKPVIAEVHGVATAAGCQLVASCDLAVAANDARFSTPGVNIGLFCSTPMVALTRAVSRKHAMEMLLTGEMISAQHATMIGLINRAVPAAEVTDHTMELAAHIASKSPLTVKIGKEAFYRQAELDTGAAYAYCSRVMTENMLTADATEGIHAFLEKCEPRWQGI